MSKDNADAGQSRELDEIIAQYFEAGERGENPDRQTLLARYPNFAQELSEFFSAQQHVAGWVPEAAAEATRTFLPSTADYQNGMVVRRVAREEKRPPTEIGRVLNGRYRIFGVKAGGMGRVYLAEDLHARNRTIALKVAIKTVVDYDQWRATRLDRGVATEFSAYRGLLTRFRAEADRWVRLKPHQNIIFAMYVFEAGGRPHLLMEYAESGDLSSWIQQGRLNTQCVVNFAIQFCHGMEHAVREDNLVHRDIKPSNVLIKDDRIVKIADFGLARAFDLSAGEPSSGGAPTTAQTDLNGIGVGTRPYMPPEQFHSLADTRSDIFSFGVMLFEMLTRCRLFGERDAYAMSLRNAALPAAHEVKPDVPRELSAVIARCVRYNPAERYPSFADVVADLVRVNDALPGRLLIPRDPKSIPTEVLTKPVRAAAVSYSQMSLGRYEEAVASAQKGIDADPTDYANWLNKGTALLELKDIGGARDCFVQATQLKPDDARSWSNLGWAELALRHPHAGLTAAEQALRLDPEFADAWMCRGCCERKLHGPEQSLHALSLAVELEPHNCKAHKNLGISLAKLGRRDAAFESFQRAAQQNAGDAMHWRELGLLYAQADRWHEAQEAANRSLRLDPENEDTRALCAWIERAAAEDGSDDQGEI